jgi:hypothetical protein
VTTSRPGHYADQTMAELRRLGAGKEQIRRIMAEVRGQVAEAPDGDLAAVLGPAEQFAGDALAGRRPVRAMYLRRLRTELRARGVPGGRIGEVLAEVDTHVADTGEDPASAFGPPEGYAARIAEETGATPEASTSTARRFLTGVPITAGTLLAVEGVVGLVRDRAAAVTLAVLLAALLLPVLNQVAGPRARRSDGLGCATAVGSLVVTQIVQIVVLVRFRQPVLADLPAWVAAVAGLATALAVIVAFRPAQRPAGLAPVIDPRPGVAHGDPTVWDTGNGDGPGVRGIVWVVVALNVAEIVWLTAVILLLW